MLEGYLDRCGNRFRYVKVSGKGKGTLLNNLSLSMPFPTTNYNFLHVLSSQHINCELTLPEKSDEPSRNVELN